MKSVISSAVLLLLFGTASSASARQEKDQAEHKQDAKPAQQESKPAQRQAKPAEQHQQQAAKPVAHEQAQNPKPSQPQHTQEAVHAQPTHTQQTARTEQPVRTQQPVHAQQTETHAVNHTAQSNAGQSQPRAQQTHAVVGNAGNSGHGRISEAHYSSSFGSGHSFHVNRGDYASRRFAYGGYSFGFIDPWPVAWGYDDDVYVVYADGGYYMYDRVHPGVRISIDIL